MTKRDALDEPLVLSADADPLDDLFDQPEGRAKARERRPVPSSGGSNSFLIAAVASLVWVAAVAAFCWSRYALPDNPGDAIEAAGLRISTGDWMLILAAILAPLALIWVIAWLMRRTAELNRQSQELTRAALRLTQAAQTAEAAGRPLALTASAEISDETPRHLRREVERATHAISALHSQMRAIEEALSTQARNIDDVAERAEQRARTIASTLRTEREALERASASVGNQGGTASTAAFGAVGAGLAGGAAMAAMDERPEPVVDIPSATSDATDFTLDTSRVEAAAMADSVEEPGDVTALRARLAEARSNARWERPTLDEHTENPLDTPDLSAEIAAEALDPFDDVAGHSAGSDDRFAIGGSAALPEVDLTDYDAPELDPADDLDAPIKLDRRHRIDWTKFTRAANFPESEDDIETLDALYDVLTDPEAASLLQCAEDTLASLADIDLYMEDFGPKLMPASVWKSHLDGSGGDALEGIDAPVEQSRIRAKLGSDKGFETLAAKFMDRYEDMGRRLLAESEDEALIVDLSNTRTGRAYLMIAGPAGRLSA